MPNWVTAKLTINGENSREKLKKLLVKDENESDDVRLDFNKILPMPKELNIVAGSITDVCVEIYVSTLSEQDAKNAIDLYINSCLFPELKRSRLFNKNASEINKIVNANISNTFKENEQFDTMNPVFHSKEEMVKYGEQVISNIKQFGSKDWYDWSIRNWGTKWNACNTSYSENDNSVYFETAWSDVRPLIFELSKQYPNNEFEYHYAEEEIGVYAGYSIFKNGEAIEDVEYPKYSKEAYEESFELWGDGCKEDYVYNEKTNTYKYIYEDENEGGME